MLGCVLAALKGEVEELIEIRIQVIVSHMGLEIQLKEDCVPIWLAIAMAYIPACQL